MDQSSLILIAVLAALAIGVIVYLLVRPPATPPPPKGSAIGNIFGGIITSLIPGGSVAAGALK